MDVKKAEHHAEHAETDAEDALDFAWWAVGEAQLSVLDALDARAWAARAMNGYEGKPNSGAGRRRFSGRICYL